MSTDITKASDPGVKYLIYEETSDEFGQFIVYIDNELDLEWESDDKSMLRINHEPLKRCFADALDGIAEMEPLLQNWPMDLKLTSKRLLGECMARVLAGDGEASKKALDTARKRIASVSEQVSRYWTLRACLSTGSVVAAAFCLEMLCRFRIEVFLGRTALLLSLAFWSGCIGAVLFIVLRLGKQPTTNSTAEKALHNVEGVARIVAGGLSGVLVSGMVKLGLLLPLFDKHEEESLAMCIAAFVAGASERIAAGVITKAEKGQDYTNLSPEKT